MLLAEPSLWPFVFWNKVLQCTSGRLIIWNYSHVSPHPLQSTFYTIYSFTYLLCVDVYFYNCACEDQRTTCRINSIMWVLDPECTSSGLEASTIMLSNTASPQSILESAQKQLRHKALAYHAKALGLTNPQCWKKKLMTLSPHYLAIPKSSHICTFRF